MKSGEVRPPIRDLTLTPVKVEVHVGVLSSAGPFPPNKTASSRHFLGLPQHCLIETSLLKIYKAPMST